VKSFRNPYTNAFVVLLAVAVVAVAVYDAFVRRPRARITSARMTQSWGYQIRLSQAGHPFLVWTEVLEDGGSQIYARRWDGSSWQEFGKGSASGGGISDTYWHSISPKILFDFRRFPIVSWVEKSRTGEEAIVYAKRWNGRKWAEIGKESASYQGISGMSEKMWTQDLVADRFGRLVSCWSNDGRVRVKRWSAAGWESLEDRTSAETGLNGTKGGNNPQVAIGFDDEPIICWNEQEADGSNLPAVYVKRWAGSRWTELGEGSAGRGGISGFRRDRQFLDIVTDKAGYPIVAWLDDRSGLAQLYVKRWNGEHWVETGVGSASGAGLSKEDVAPRDPSLFVDKEGRPIVAWIGSGMIRIKRWSGEQWEDHAQKHLEPGCAMIPSGYASAWSTEMSMDLDPDEGLFLAWTELSHTHPRGKLVIMHCLNGTWEDITANMAWRD